MTGFLYFLIAAAAMLCSGFIAGAETVAAELKASRVGRLRRRGNIPAAEARVLELVLARRDSFLGCTLIGTILCNVVAAVLMVAALWNWGASPLVAATGAALLVCVDLLVFGQMAPKNLFRQNALELGLKIAPAMRLLLRLFSPLSISFGRISAALVRLAGSAHPPKFAFVTREELKSLAPPQKSEAAGNASRMIHGVFDMRQKTVRDLMVPMDKVIVIDADATADNLLALARETGFSRLPVVEQTSPAPSQDAGQPPKAAPSFGSAKGTVLGIVNVYDLLFATDPLAGRKARDFVRRPAILSDTDPPDRALQRLRVAHLPMALVTDAQQQVVGLITIDNIVAQIVGKAA